MTARLFVKALPFLLLATAAAACTSTPHAATPEAAVTPVRTVTVEMTDLTTRFENGGVIRARTTAFVASRLMAPIVQVHVRPGDHVRRDQVLVTLDARDMDAAQAQTAAAALAADETARAAEADLRAAESALKLARASFDRISALHAKRSATNQELDQATAVVTAAEAQRTGAGARVAAAAASRDAAHAAARAADVTATYAKLTAPFDGIVVERRADPGSMAAPGAPLLTIEDPSAYRLELQIDEARAASVRIGQSADVCLGDTSEGDCRTGHVVEIARVDSASHAFLVKLDLPATADVRSGLFGRASFAGPSRRTLTVPASAIVRRGQLSFAYVIDTDGRPRLRAISPGTVDRDRVEVLAGLREHDRIATDPGAVK